MPNSELNKFIWPFLAILFVIAVSVPVLNTKPHLWADEAKSIELARNFADYGKLEIQTAPGEFTGFPQVLQSTGYPVTVPLALVFRLFGFGLTQARIYMLLWMALFLVVGYMFSRRLSGNWQAIAALFLIVSFASFYDSGRTVVGEIPGMVFLILGLYFWLFRNAYYWSGFWLGLSVVTKPSVFGLIIPAIALFLLLEREEEYFKKIFKIGIGMIPAAVVWILLVLGSPFSSSAWLSIINLYGNPYSSSSLWQNIINNFLNIPYSTTIIYFGLLFLLIILSKQFSSDKKMKSFFDFTVIYCIFAFIYYLRSPGWLRYLLIADFLILFSLPSVLYVLTARIKEFFPKLKFLPENLSAVCLSLLIVIQFVHFFTSAQIFYSDSAIKVSKLLNEEFSSKIVGVINSLDVSVLLKTNQRFQIIEMTGIPIMGKNPLLLGVLPEIIVFARNERFLWGKEEILSDNYVLFSEINDFIIYKRKY